MSDTDDWGLDAATPPSRYNAPQSALWWLAKGNWEMGAAWEKAHEICQSQEGEHAHDLVHGLAHWIEGDEWNSDYWYRRAGATRHSERAAIEGAHLMGQI